MGFLTDQPFVQAGVTRSLDSEFTISAVSPTLVVYTIELSVTAPLLSTESVKVELWVGPDSPPSAKLATASLASAQLAGLGLISVNVVERQPLITWVPANSKIKLISSGAGDATIVDQMELTFGPLS